MQCCCVEATYRDSAELVTVENAASSAVTLEERADFAPLVCSEGFEFTTSFANLAGLSGVGFEAWSALPSCLARAVLVPPIVAGLRSEFPGR